MKDIFDIVSEVSIEKILQFTAKKGVNTRIEVCGTPKAVQATVKRKK